MVTDRVRGAAWQHNMPPSVVVIFKGTLAAFGGILTHHTSPSITVSYMMCVWRVGASQKVFNPTIPVLKAGHLVS